MCLFSCTYTCLIRVMVDSKHGIFGIQEPSNASACHPAYLTIARHPSLTFDTESRPRHPKQEKTQRASPINSALARPGFTSLNHIPTTTHNTNTNFHASHLSTLINADCPVESIAVMVMKIQRVSRLLCHGPLLPEPCLPCQPSHCQQRQLTYKLTTIVVHIPGQESTPSGGPGCRNHKRRSTLRSSICPCQTAHRRHPRTCRAYHHQELL
jgi:hypothetical protein